jgi:GNAT superfamily N-acetyltransferase
MGLDKPRNSHRIHIRRATIDDVGALLRVKRPGLTERCFALDKQQRRRFDLVSDGTAEYLLAARPREVVAHVFLMLAGARSAPGYPDIEDLYVREDWRGQGIGRRLIAACEVLALERGFTRIGLSVNPTLNGRARRLYERLGYHDVGRPVHLDGVYADVEDWCIEMAKPLAPSGFPSVFSKKEQIRST